MTPQNSTVATAERGVDPEKRETPKEQPPMRLKSQGPIGNLPPTPPPPTTRVLAPDFDSRDEILVDRALTTRLQFDPGVVALAAFQDGSLIKVDYSPPLPVYGYLVIIDGPFVRDAGCPLKVRLKDAALPEYEGVTAAAISLSEGNTVALLLGEDEELRRIYPILINPLAAGALSEYIAHEISEN